MQKETFIKQYAAGLNPQQLAAVQAVHGPVLLLAVPGSGKTTVLVTRLGYMVLCCDVPPAQILTMTYTVAATHEMRGRFAARFGAELAGQMTFRTINGLSAVILQYYSRVYGRRQPELLTNEGDITRMLTDIWQQVNREFPTESTLKELRTAITYIKNMALADEEIEGLETDLANLPELYRRYQAALKRAGQMDYDDQMVFALQILRAAPPVLAYFQQRYKYFCVDESQDTSKIQHEIIRLLAGRSLNLFMVGDYKQDIGIIGVVAHQLVVAFGGQEAEPHLDVLAIQDLIHIYFQVQEVAVLGDAVLAELLLVQQALALGTQVIDLLQQVAQIGFGFLVRRVGVALLFMQFHASLFRHSLDLVAGGGIGVSLVEGGVSQRIRHITGGRFQVKPAVHTAGIQEIVQLGQGALYPHQLHLFNQSVHTPFNRVRRSRSAGLGLLRRAACSARPR